MDRARSASSRPRPFPKKERRAPPSKRVDYAWAMVLRTGGIIRTLEVGGLFMKVLLPALPRTRTDKVLIDRVGILIRWSDRLDPHRVGEYDPAKKIVEPVGLPCRNQQTLPVLVQTHFDREPLLEDAGRNDGRFVAANQNL